MQDIKELYKNIIWVLYKNMVLYKNIKKDSASGRLSAYKLISFYVCMVLYKNIIDLFKFFYYIMRYCLSFWFILSPPEKGFKVFQIFDFFPRVLMLSFFPVSLDSGPGGRNWGEQWSICWYWEDWLQGCCFLYTNSEIVF